MTKRKRRGGKIKSLDDVTLARDDDRRYDMGDLPNWARQPDVQRFLAAREKLKDPEVYGDPDKLEQVKEEVFRLRDLAMGKSVQLRDHVNRNMEMAKMRANMSMPPEMAQRMQAHQGKLGDITKGFDSTMMKDPYYWGLAQSKGFDPEHDGIDLTKDDEDIIVWGCPKCGNTDTNFVQLSTKKQKKYAKRYKFLDYDDLHRDKGYRYCSKCKTDHDLGFMVKMSMAEADELQMKKAEEERKKRNRHPDTLRMPTEAERKATKERLEERREREAEREEEKKDRKRH